MAPPFRHINGKLRDEFVAREIFDTVMEARIFHRDDTHTYHHRPHSTSAT